jgi:hypothetical protein
LLQYVDAGADVADGFVDWGIDEELGFRDVFEDDAGFEVDMLDPTVEEAGPDNVPLSVALFEVGDAEVEAGAVLFEVEDGL